MEWKTLPLLLWVKGGKEVREGMLKNMLKRDKRRQTLSLDDLMIMACPSCRFPVVFPKDAKEVQCPLCGRTFEVPSA